MLTFLVLSLLVSPIFAWISYPTDGYATMTHYDLPRDYIAACGCTGGSTHYPTAAMSQMAYGSSNAYGLPSQAFTGFLGLSDVDLRSCLWKMLQFDACEHLSLRPSILSTGDHLANRKGQVLAVYVAQASNAGGFSHGPLPTHRKRMVLGHGNKN